MIMPEQDQFDTVDHNKLIEGSNLILQQITDVPKLLPIDGWMLKAADDGST